MAHWGRFLTKVSGNALRASGASVALQAASRREFAGLSRRRGPHPAPQLATRLCRFKRPGAPRRGCGGGLRGLAGAGAAGGLPTACAAMLSARLVSGSDWIIRALSLPEDLSRCTLVVTGEGRLDQQSLQGKGAWRLASLASARSIPCLYVVGASALPARRLPRGVHVVLLEKGPPSTADRLSNTVAHAWFPLVETRHTCDHAGQTPRSHLQGESPSEVRGACAAIRDATTRSMKKSKAAQVLD